MKWLEDLLERIASFLESNPVIEEPDEEVAENEKIIGEVPEDLRKLRAYNSSLVKKANELVKTHMKEHVHPNQTSEMCKKFHDSILPLGNEIEITRLFFWSRINNELKIHNGNTGLRKGWKVVEIPEESEKSERPEIHIVGIGDEIDPFFANFVRAMTH
jgi:hypothetical protein